MKIKSIHTELQDRECIDLIKSFCFCLVLAGYKTEEVISAVWDYDCFVEEHLTPRESATNPQPEMTI